jgi:NAD(P)-dependent dehydrogenase (short-subunit alcohol dehydrogenase family)
MLAVRNCRFAAPLHIDDIRGQRLADSGERSYVIAKTMMLMFTRELARRMEGTGVDVMAGNATPSGQPKQHVWLSGMHHTFCASVFTYHN